MAPDKTARDARGVGGVEDGVEAVLRRSRNRHENLAGAACSHSREPPRRGSRRRRPRMRRRAHVGCRRGSRRRAPRFPPRARARGSDRRARRRRSATRVRSPRRPTVSRSSRRASREPPTRTVQRIASMTKICTAGNEPIGARRDQDHERRAPIRRTAEEDRDDVARSRVAPDPAVDAERDEEHVPRREHHRQLGKVERSLQVGHGPPTASRYAARNEAQIRTKSATTSTSRRH